MQSSSGPATPHKSAPKAAKAKRTPTAMSKLRKQHAKSAAASSPAAATVARDALGGLPGDAWQIIAAYALCTHRYAACAGLFAASRSIRTRTLCSPRWWEHYVCGELLTRPLVLPVRLASINAGAGTWRGTLSEAAMHARGYMRDFKRVNNLSESQHLYRCVLAMMANGWNLSVALDAAAAATGTAVAPAPFTATLTANEWLDSSKMGSLTNSASVLAYSGDNDDFGLAAEVQKLTRKSHAVMVMHALTMWLFEAVVPHDALHALTLVFGRGVHWLPVAHKDTQAYAKGLEEACLSAPYRTHEREVDAAKVILSDFMSMLLRYASAARRGDSWSLDWFSSAVLTYAECSRTRELRRMSHIFDGDASHTLPDILTMRYNNVTYHTCAPTAYTLTYMMPPRHSDYRYKIDYGKCVDVLCHTRNWRVLARTLCHMRAHLNAAERKTVLYAVDRHAGIYKRLTEPKPPIVAHDESLAAAATDARDASDFFTRVFSVYTVRDLNARMRDNFTGRENDPVTCAAALMRVNYAAPAIARLVQRMSNVAEMRLATGMRERLAATLAAYQHDIERAQATLLLGPPRTSAASPAKPRSSSSSSEPTVKPRAPIERKVAAVLAMDIDTLDRGVYAYESDSYDSDDDDDDSDSDNSECGQTSDSDSDSKPASDSDGDAAVPQRAKPPSKKQPTLAVASLGRTRSSTVATTVSRKRSASVSASTDSAAAAAAATSTPKRATTNTQNDDDELDF